MARYVGVSPRSEGLQALEEESRRRPPRANVATRDHRAHEGVRRSDPVRNLHEKEATEVSMVARGVPAIQELVSDRSGVRSSSYLRVGEWGRCTNGPSHGDLDIDASQESLSGSSDT